jgi:DNA-binding NtrC family response regulator
MNIRHTDRVAAVMQEEQLNKVRGALERLGVTVVAATETDEAIRSSANVVVCDADYGEGWRRNTQLILGYMPKARVILLSRLADERLWVEALAAGAFDVLPEPCEPEALCSSVSGALTLQRHGQAA